MRYAFLDKGATADIEFEAYGETLEEMFESAALAMFKVISNPEKVESAVKNDVKVVSEDLEALLYDFLEHFLYLHDAENLVFSTVKVRKIKKTAEGYRLEASVEGEEFNPEKHESGTHVKAITYHGMKIGKKRNKYFCYLILDI
jgi:SHS2 domain-containing protein